MLRGKNIDEACPIKIRSISVSQHLEQIRDLQGKLLASEDDLARAVMLLDNSVNMSLLKEACKLVAAWTAEPLDSVINHARALIESGKDPFDVLETAGVDKQEWKREKEGQGMYRVYLRDKKGKKWYVNQIHSFRIRLTGSPRHALLAGKDRAHGIELNLKDRFSEHAGMEEVKENVDFR